MSSEFFTAEALCLSGYSLALLLLCIIDLHSYQLPNWLTWPLLCAGLLVNHFELFCPLESAVLGSTTGYISIAGLHYYGLFRYQKIIIGLGDAKLLAALLAWSGLASLPTILLNSSLIGIGLILLRRAYFKIPTKAPIAFGPALALASFLDLVVLR